MILEGIAMIRTCDLRQKEVINIRNAEKLGYIRDVEINFADGKIDAVIIPKRGGILNFFSTEKEYEILWGDIVKIGKEVVLVDYPE